MRIGIDLQVLAKRPWTGIAKYAYHLARALRELKTNHEFVFFVPENSPSPPLIPSFSSSPLARDVTSELVGEERWGGERGGRGEFIVLPSKTIPFWSAHITYARIMQKARLDVLHGPANTIPWFYPLSISPLSWGRNPFPFLPLPEGRGRGRGGKVKTVITIHDLAIYKDPEWFPRGQWFSTKIAVPQSIKKADAIIVPSHTTARDVTELFRVPSEKIHVIPHAPSPYPLPLERGRGGEGVEHSHYILFVGTLEPRKNVARLIEAYQELPEEIRREYDLVIAGATPSYSPPIQGTGGENGSGFSPSRREGGEEEGVRFLGYVPDEDLGALYQNASLFVYPSLYEGFGMPVLEAMAAGVPVVTSKGSAMEELATSPGLPPPSPVLGRVGGEVEPFLLVNPYSVPEIRDAILKLIRPVRPGSGSPRPLGHELEAEWAGPRWRDVAYASQISLAGQKLMRKYTWQRTALETLRVYEALA